MPIPLPMAVTLHPNQSALVSLPADRAIFLEGPAGAGKTTAGVHRLLHLLRQGVPAGSVLVLTPQRTLAAPYSDALRTAKLRAGGAVTVVTAGGLAQRTVELFWPLVAEEAGFAHPDRPPTFLTLETAQYYMARLVRPLLDQGLFEAATIDRHRLYSQIIDNLNKAAVVGFPLADIGRRLLAAAGDDPVQARIFADAQHCATLFRDYCLAHNLLDFSLQVELFWRHLWPLPAVREHLMRTYRHVIADNVEEDTPFAHDLLAGWLPRLTSALLICDRDAGYRQFLGADPQGAQALRALCAEQWEFNRSLVMSPPVEFFGGLLAAALRPDHRTSSAQAAAEPAEATRAAVHRVLVYDYQRYYPQMLDWVADRVAALVHEENTPPREIVVLAPFLGDALRFSLMARLEQRSVPVRSHRPSRALRDEPATHCLLTLAALAHPQWGVLPTKFDFAYALMQAIDGMDLVRAQLLAEIVYRPKEGAPTLTAFDQINPDAHERITYVLGGRYEGLRIWLADYRDGRRPETPLDHFLGRLFGEVLSQPGYGFHGRFDAAEVAANLVESVQKFRWVAEAELAAQGRPLGREYWDMVQDGVIAAQYVQSWQLSAAGRDNAVLLAPAHTFLMSNRPVDYQVWLDVGSRGWFERLYQPLTHPYVLSRQWEEDRPWGDAEEVAASQERLARLTLGLVRRCRKGIYLGLSELSEQGYELRGPLLQALHHALQRLPAEAAVAES